MWDEVEMPDRAHRLDDLLKYARATYPEFEPVEKIQAACEAAVDATHGYSLRGYYTFGVHEERAAVLAAVLSSASAAPSASTSASGSA